MIDVGEFAKVYVADLPEIRRYYPGKEEINVYIMAMDFPTCRVAAEGGNIFELPINILRLPFQKNKQAARLLEKEY